MKEKETFVLQIATFEPQFERFVGKAKLHLLVDSFIKLMNLLLI